MTLTDFIAFHSPALEKDQARYNLILGILEKWAAAETPGNRTWTLGGPGCCAIQSAGRPILLGELDRVQCRALADKVRHLDYNGVNGTIPMVQWFVERAGEFGHLFSEPIPLRIHALKEAPRYPGSSGSLRVVTMEDKELILSWMVDFRNATIAEGPPFNLDPGAVQAGDYCLWTVKGQAVSMALINRRTKTTATISAVYTPPPFRRRGFGGSVTAGVAERIFKEGKEAACLYTDLRNPYSNRCYAKIGFKPVCDCASYIRKFPAPADGA